MSHGKDLRARAVALSRSGLSARAVEEALRAEGLAVSYRSVARWAGQDPGPAAPAPSPRPRATTVPSPTRPAAARPPRPAPAPAAPPAPAVTSPATGQRLVKRPARPKAAEEAPPPPPAPPDPPGSSPGSGGPPDGGGDEELHAEALDALAAADRSHLQLLDVHERICARVKQELSAVQPNMRPLSALTRLMIDIPIALRRTAPPREYKPEDDPLNQIAAEELLSRLEVLVAAAEESPAP